MPRKSGIARGRALWGSLVVAAVAALVSLPALHNGLFWDDAIVLARQVPAMGGVRGAFFPPAGLPQFIPSYYRPVVFLTLFLDRALWGANVFGFHLDVWLLHALTAGSFFLLMRRLIAGSGVKGAGEWVGALAAGLLFAVHPVHAEAVAWIMGRADVLAALFTVVGLLAVAGMASRDGPAVAGMASRDGAADRGQSARGRGHLLLALTVGLASALALLSKESAIVLPALTALVFAAAPTGNPRNNGLREPTRPPGHPRFDRSARGRLFTKGAMTAVGAAAAGIVLALGLRVLAVTGQASVAPAAAASAASPLADSLARLPGALVFSLRRLLWPWPTPVFHAQVPPITAAGALGALLFLALVAAACASSRSGRAAAVFTGAALLPAFAPALTRVSLSPVADRYLYIPSLGVCWMAGAIAARLFAAPRIRRPAPMLLVLAPMVWTAAAAWTSYRAVASYRDDASYWSAALERSPSDPFLLMKHGQHLADAGRFTEAEAELRRALTLGETTLGRSTRTVILDNLGDIALRQGHLDEARLWLDRAVELGPGYGLARVHLGRWHRTRQLAAARDPSESAKALAAEESRLAIASLDKAIQLEPTNTEALLMRADLAIDMGDKPSAIAAIREALLYLPAGAHRSRVEAALRSIGG